MAAKMEIFQRWARSLEKLVLGCEQVQHHVWIVLGPFCAIKLLSDARYVTGYVTAESKNARRCKIARKNFINRALRIC